MSTHHISAILVSYAGLRAMSIFAMSAMILAPLALNAFTCSLKGWLVSASAALFAMPVDYAGGVQPSERYSRCTVVLGLRGSTSGRP